MVYSLIYPGFVKAIGRNDRIGLVSVTLPRVAMHTASTQVAVRNTLRGRDERG